MMRYSQKLWKFYLYCLRVSLSSEDYWFNTYEGNVWISYVLQPAGRMRHSLRFRCSRNTKGQPVLVLVILHLMFLMP